MEQPQTSQPIQGPDEQSLKDALTTQVRRRIREAMDARSSSGIEEIWQEDADQYDGIDALSAIGKNVKDVSNSPRGDQNNARSRVFLNITKPKTDAAVARVQEMLVPHDDKPWEIGPTPVPELMEALDAQSEEMVTLGDGTQAKAADVAEVAMDKATKASEKCC